MRLQDIVAEELTELEKSGDLVVTSENGIVASAISTRIESYLPTSFTDRELQGLIDLIREALWGASSFYDDEMAKNLIGLSEQEFKDLVEKLSQAARYD